MDTIIYDLYYGELRPFEMRTPHDVQYGQVSEVYSQAESALRAGMTEEEGALLDRLTEAHLACLDLLEQDAFALGFRLGGRMMAEMLG